MAGADKHRKRSHRSYRATESAFGRFRQNAAVKKQRVENRNILKELFHRTQDK